MYPYIKIAETISPEYNDKIAIIDNDDKKLKKASIDKVVGTLGTAKGDLLVLDSTGSFVNLPLGEEDSFLRIKNGNVVWSVVEDKIQKLNDKIDAALSVSATFILVDENPDALANAVSSLDENDVLEIRTNATYNPILINKSNIIIRNGLGYRPVITGNGGIKLANGINNVIICGLTLKNCGLFENINHSGAAISFNDYHCIVNNIIFYDISISNVLAGSAVLLSYHWRKGGDYYYNPPQENELSSNIWFIKCNLYSACKDGNEGACIALRAVKESGVIDCNINNINNTGRGIQFQGVKDVLVKNCFICNNTTNGEGIKIDQIGNSPFRNSGIFIGNTVFNCVEGIDIDDNTQCYVVDNIVYSCQDGIVFDGGSVPANAIGVGINNVAYLCNIGIKVEDGSVVSLYNNNSYNNTTNYSLPSGYILDNSNISDKTVKFYSGNITVPSFTGILNNTNTVASSLSKIDNLIVDHTPLENQVLMANSSGKYEPKYLSQSVNIKQKDRIYVDVLYGDDTNGNGDINSPYKTISKALSVLGQPVSADDYRRVIEIILASGVYNENLLVPYRCINFKGNGVTINGNVINEVSSAHRWGVSSSDFRASMIFQGNTIEARDSHNRKRQGIFINGSVTVKVITRNIASIYGDGNNKVTITVSETYQIDLGIRIKVENTLYYDAVYDITNKINDTTFEATRVSGTNSHTETENTGIFYETDSAGSSMVTHDVVFLSTRIDGNVNDFDGTNGYPSTGQGVWYFINSCVSGNIEGRGIYVQRWINNEFKGSILVNNIVNLENNIFNGNITVNTGFIYDLGWKHNQFGTITFTLPINQTIYMDLITKRSWDLNVTPNNSVNIVLLDDHGHDNLGDTYKVLIDSTDSNPDYIKNKIDDVTLGINSYKIQVKDNSITADKIASNVDVSNKGFNSEYVNSRKVNDNDISINSLWTSNKIVTYISDVITNLDAQESVKSFYDPVGGLPPNPQVGDRYISQGTANGWVINNIYEWSGSVWEETVANEGMMAYVENEDLIYVFNGSNWVVWASGTNHNSLSGLQGGQANEYYHLTQNQHNLLTNNQEASSLHNHDNRYYTETEIDNLLSDKIYGSGSSNKLAIWQDNNTVTYNNSLYMNSNILVVDTLESINGIILKSPDNNRWLLTIDNNGNLSTTLI